MSRFRPVETIEGWQCAGCGRIDAPQPCIGVCRDRRVSLVAASDYAALSARADALERRLARLAAFVGTVAHVCPHPDGWERSFRSLQLRARALLAQSDHAAVGPAAGPPD